MLKVTDIVWKTDEEEVVLPSTVFIDKDIEPSEVVIKKWLFNRYGYYVLSIGNYTIT